MDYQALETCYKSIRQMTDFVPEIAIVLGSGLGDFADTIEVLGEISYKDIDNFPVSTAPGHAGKFVFGLLSGKKVICMKGRIHFYEGYGAEEVILPIRLIKMMGAKKVMLTNAAGGLNAEFRIGDFMMLTDHISLFAYNPLIGKNISELGERFTDMSVPYDKELCDIVRACAKRLAIPLKEGVYAQVTGPSYESPAETRLLRGLGADAVGMSTVMETIAARHMGMQVCAISCITNITYDISGKQPNEQEVMDAGKKNSKLFTAFITEIVKNM
ncbi:MAG: purine-nucleoside phosphorylase [Clostridia bacterium]|nr:purine-nucleoside phosphorylase [Clostridia bacterium]